MFLQTPVSNVAFWSWLYATLEINWCAVYINAVFRGLFYVISFYWISWKALTCTKQENLKRYVFFSEIPFFSILAKIKWAASVFFCSRCQTQTSKNHPPTSAACTGREITVSCQSDPKTSFLMTQGLFPSGSMVNILRITSSNTNTPHNFNCSFI